MADKDPYLFAVAALWLSVPATALHFWMAWDRLPQRMATHFDASWHPNGWSARGDALGFAIGILAFILIVLTPACLLVRSRKPGSAWPVLVIAYVAVAFIGWTVNSLVSRNLPVS